MESQSTAHRDVRVLVQDDGSIVTGGMARALEQQGYLVTHIEDLATAQTRASPIETTVAVLHVCQEEAFAAVAHLRLVRPDLLLVALFAERSADGARRALAAGAVAVLDSEQTTAECSSVIVAALEGWTALPTTLMQDLVSESIGASEAKPSEVLSEGECTMLAELGSGATVAAFANHHHFSERTVYRRLKDAYRRLGVLSLRDAVAVARHRGLLRHAEAPAQPAPTPPAASSCGHASPMR